MATPTSKDSGRNAARITKTVRVNGVDEPITITTFNTKGGQRAPISAGFVPPPTGRTLYERIINSRGNDELIRREQTRARRRRACIRAGFLMGWVAYGLVVFALARWLLW